MDVEWLDGVQAIAIAAGLRHMSYRYETQCCQVSDCDAPQTDAFS